VEGESLTDHAAPMKSNVKPAPKGAVKRDAKARAKAGASASIPAAAALSFLRETRGLSTWTARDMIHALKISSAEANQVIAAFEMQGYVNRLHGDEWMTTFAGESVSASKPPRYTRDRIDEALSSLRDRIAKINRDAGAPYRITEVVAFGDFLGDRTRFQPAEIGIALEPRKPASISIVGKRQTEQEFLRQLRDRSALVQLRPYEPWMRARTHRDLLLR
jgi:hypothetical protein